jgi:light-regulated signal transduction histidine kinase (bacteriophytochrome)
MDAVKPTGAVSDYELNSADQARPAPNNHDNVAEGGQRFLDMQRALINILEDATEDRLRAEAAARATLNILEDLSKARAEIETLNAGLEARVRQRTAELVVANENLESFAYSVAHDLRSPLRALNGFSEALVEDYGDRLDATGRLYTERIQAGTERMSALIDDLLILAQVSRAKMNLGLVDLSAEVAALAVELHAREPGRRVRFAIDANVRATADRILIRTVVQNLVENAWKFTAKRDEATIEFASIAAKDAEICCYVRDNGAGFDSAFVDKLFQPFQRLHSVTEFPGTGIGLVSVQRIVERHGGHTWAEGAVGRGATFYFTLNAKGTHHDLALSL